MAHPIVPPIDIPSEIVELLTDLGAPPAIADVTSYRELAHRPELLRAWTTLSWSLRLHGMAPRALHELAVTRTLVQIPHAHFEIASHVKFSLEFGITQEQLDHLDTWRSSDLFSEPERAVLALADAMILNEVAPEVADELQRHFEPAAIVDLIVACGFYSMCARVNEALGAF